MRKFLAKIPALRRLYYHSTSNVPYKRYRPDKKRLSEITAKNRAILATVDSWISDETYENSIFQYGLPSYIRGFIDHPISSKPSYTDLLVYLAGETVNLRYLELGPSVGKTFLQMISAVPEGEFTAVDIEDINPVLASRLNETSSSEWPAMVGSKRQRPGRDATFDLPGRSAKVRYVAGDLFDPATWDRLSGGQFNLVFSDAFHSAEALLMEWRNLRDRNLLSPSGFTMVWDDLTSKQMRGAFNEIVTEMRSIHGKDTVTVSLELFQGWVGENEFLHPIGIVRHHPSPAAPPNAT